MITFSIEVSINWRDPSDTKVPIASADYYIDRTNLFN